LATRVIVDEDATEEQILEAAKHRFIDKVQTELGEHLEFIGYDDECPYDPDMDFFPSIDVDK
jgi:hypothetical protein